MARNGRSGAGEGVCKRSAAYGGLVYCSDFYRNREYTELGRASPADVSRFLEGFFRQRDAHDLLATLRTWQHADASDNDVGRGDLSAALANPSDNDCIDSELEELLVG